MVIDTLYFNFLTWLLAGSCVGVLWLILHQHWARHYHPDGKDYLTGCFLSNFHMRVLGIFPNETHSLHHSQKTAQTYLDVTIISFLSFLRFSNFLWSNGYEFYLWWRTTVNHQHNINDINKIINLHPVSLFFSNLTSSVNTLPSTFVFTCQWINFLQVWTIVRCKINKSVFLYQVPQLQPLSGQHSSPFPQHYHHSYHGCCDWQIVQY